MRRWLIAGLLVFVAVLAAFLFWPKATSESPLRVGIAPYQDLAMLVNAQPLGLEKKYGTKIELITMGWEEIPPAVASAGRAVDVGFGSYIEYLTKYSNLNAGSNDPVLFIYPLYAFKGGAFVTFKEDVPRVDAQAVNDPNSPAVKALFGYRIGAQKASVYDMMLHQLAASHGVDMATIKIIDTPLDQGFLAAQQGSLDVSTAGLTQLTETQRRGGRVVLTMSDMRFADLTGFIAKKSTYEARKADIHNLIRMWFESVDYVYRDLDRNSATSLAYLNKNASTRYTLPEYKSALSQEFLPRTIAEAHSAFILPNGQFPASTIGVSVNRYLLERGIINSATPIPQFPNMVSAAH